MVTIIVVEVTHSATEDTVDIEYVVETVAVDKSSNISLRIDRSGDTGQEYGIPPASDVVSISEKDKRGRSSSKIPRLNK
ncbi:hypothetical protein PoB_004965000 [Plakobranchus ocellatus]|uniref:Cadherin domain-containing protein n=1 Tax=Plakobranchus ocellatus TaxID=259542 RepID=A0AAV4BVL2_9GAST|nr:hypothetical protein PoB_004965000 [Plakobranchus ocellatus]